MAIANGHNPWLNASFTVNKKCLLKSFCATALSAWTSTANAYTAIALAAGEKGPLYECYGYSHLPNRVSKSVIEQRALENCRLVGGINPKIVLSTGEPGYFALAISKEEKGRILGWSGPLPNPESATEEAIANCKKRGGRDPRITAHWADGMSGKRRQNPSLAKFDDV